MTETVVLLVLAIGSFAIGTIVGWCLADTIRWFWLTKPSKKSNKQPGPIPLHLWVDEKTDLDS